MDLINTSISKTEHDVQRYLDHVFEKVKQRDPNEEEFHQAVHVFFHSIKPTLLKNPKYIQHNILERLVEPERSISFQVPWVDDSGKTQVNRGYRVQFNSAIGPYKGGLRFHPTVSLSIMKFLAFQQIFKNSLTNQPIGGGKGGSDFNPKGKSDQEIMRFCQSFMTELARHIGPYKDIPAGDIGVGAREIGYLFGQYKKIRGKYEAGVLTGKGLHYGGSIGRKEATGYGVIYFVQEILKSFGLYLGGRKMIVSGSGNVSIYAMEKAMELGAKVIACSDSSGYIYDPNGINLDTVKQLKEVEQKRIFEYVDRHKGATYVEGCSGIWSIPCDIALPCATQNEIDETAAHELIKNGTQIIAEGANMPSTEAAIQVFQQSDIIFAPAMAVNAGGVAVSSLEMAQNSSFSNWTLDQVDDKLQRIMKNIYQNCIEEAEQHDQSGNLVVGANIAGFKKVADAMIDQGVV